MKFSRKKTNLTLGISFLLIALVFLILFLCNVLTGNQYLISIITGAIGLIFVVLGIFDDKLKEGTNKHFTTRRISLIAIMGAISGLLYIFIKFNLPFFPPWLDIQISELPALIVGFAYGPIEGIAVLVVRYAIKAPFSSTVQVGELADLMIGIVYILVSSLIYKKHKSIKGALASLGIASLAGTTMAIISNRFILIPFYLNVMNWPLSALVNMCSFMPGITEQNFYLYYLFIGVLPFNLMRYIIVDLITFVLYKQTHRFIDHIAS